MSPKLIRVSDTSLFGAKHWGRHAEVISTAQENPLKSRGIPIGLVWPPSSGPVLETWRLKFQL